MNNKIKAVILDFDGTIADSIEVFAKIAEKITGSSERIHAEEIKSIRGLIRFGQRIDIPLWRVPLALTKVRKLVDNHIYDIKPFDGVTDVIESLYHSGYKLFIVSTNTKQSIKKFLVHYQLDSYFENIYGSRKLVRNKVKSLKRLIKENQLNASDCVYIGDEPRDIEAGWAVNMKCVAVTWGFGSKSSLQALTPAYLASDTSDILRFLRIIDSF